MRLKKAPVRLVLHAGVEAVVAGTKSCQNHVILTRREVVVICFCLWLRESYDSRLTGADIVVWCLSLKLYIAYPS